MSSCRQSRSCLQVSLLDRMDVTGRDQTQVEFGV